MDLGINLSPVNDYNREWVFSNIFAQSRQWRLISSGQVQPPSVRVPVLANGYPDFTAIAQGDAVQSLMLIDHDGHYPKGTYIAIWRGDTIGVSFTGRNVRVLSTTQNDYGFWVAKIDVQGDSGFALELRNANITELSIYMPGHANKIFHPSFSSPLKKFKFVRFLNWMNTNSVNRPYTWEERTSVLSPRQSYQPQGVAIEAMIYLCNETKTDPWFCMPHIFDDNFMRRFAMKVKKNCEADKIYVEFSNETWNNIFPVHAWAKAEAARLNIIWPHVIADAAKHMWSIWLDVFGDQSHKLVRVVGGQASNEWIARKILERLNNDADMVAIASYFSIPKNQVQNLNSSSTAQDVLNIAKATLPGLLNNIHEHKRFGLPVGIYEGGQGIVGGDGWLRAAYDAQLLPEMYDVTLQNINQAESAGVTHFGVFSYVSRRDSPHGSWGHFESQDQLELNPSSLRQQAPKGAAINDSLQ